MIEGNIQLPEFVLSYRDKNVNLPSLGRAFPDQLAVGISCAIPISHRLAHPAAI